MTGQQESEMIVRFVLQGTTYLLKLTGAAGIHMAALVKATIERKDEAGQKKLAQLLKSGEALQVFTIDQSMLDEFKSEAKRYGIQYCIAEVDDKDLKEGTLDILVKSSDAPRINRIAERLNMATLEGSVQETDDKPAARNEIMDLMQDMFAPNAKEREGETEINPSLEFEEVSENSSTDTNAKPSIKESLASIKGEIAETADLFAQARSLRENMMGIGEGWERPAEEYDQEGNRTYNGKSYADLTEKESVQLMVDNEMLQNGRLSNDFIRNMMVSGYKVNRNGKVEEIETSMSAEELKLIVDMMQPNKDEKARGLNEQ